MKKREAGRLSERIKDYKEGARVIKDTEEEMEAQERKVQDILDDLLVRYRENTEFCAGISGLQQSFAEIKVYKNKRMAELSGELQKNLKKMEKDMEKSEERDVWD